MNTIKLTPSQLQDPYILKALKFRNVLSHYLAPFMKGDFIDTSVDEIRKVLQSVDHKLSYHFAPAAEGFLSDGPRLVTSITVKDGNRANVALDPRLLYEWVHLGRPLGSIAEEIRAEFLRFLFKETAAKYRDVDITLKL